MQTHSQQSGQRTTKKVEQWAHTPENIEKLPNPYEAKSADLTTRAKAWLHTNCASCHVEAGGGNAKMQLRFDTPLEKMKIINEKPVHTNFQDPQAMLVAPGSPEHSVLLKRISIRGKDQMPPLSTHVVDEAGVKLIREWIESLPVK
ncbi:MAG: hypothetical protein R3B84_13250 [Zavarzinella sp.]